MKCTGACTVMGYGSLVAVVVSPGTVKVVGLKVMVTPLTVPWA